MASFSSASFLRLCLFTVLAAVIFVVREPEGRDQRFEIDEAEWLTISIETTRQALGEVSPFDGIPPSPYRDEDGNPWKVGIHQSTFGFMNPLLPKLVFGSTALALGHTDYSPAIFPRFAKGLPPDRAQSAMRSVFPALGPVRTIVLLLASLSAALVFVVTRRIGGFAAGVFAFALFVASPVVSDHATRIRTDFFPIALALGALALAMRAASSLGGERGSKSTLQVALALGTLAGLAVGSKLNGALLALMIGAWIPLAWSVSRAKSGSSAIAGILVPWCVAGFATLALYFAFSPHLWPAPIENLGALMEAWDGDLTHQKDKFGERLGRADTIGEHLALSSKAIAGEHEPLFALTGLPLGVPLALIGLIALIAATRRTHAPTDAKLLVVYILIAGVGTALWLPFGRNNFYLGFAPVVAILEGLALGLPVVWLLRSKLSPDVEN